MANNFQDIRIFNDDLLITNGDFSMWLSDEQHIVDIIQSFRGEWKQYPEVGVGLGAYLASSGQEQSISRDIVIQLTADGYQVKSPDFKTDSTGKLTVAPHAIR